VNAFAEKRAARVDRLRSAAVRAQSEAARRFGTAHAIGSMIPMGQPILVGHHSERRARRDAERIHNNTRKGVEAHEAAKEFARRADAAENNDAVYRDDPDALELLREKLAEAETLHARWRAINAAIRKGTINALALTADEKRDIAFAPCGTGFKATNAAANVRRIKARIAELSKVKP
jgi:hypothetical protein